MACVFSRTSAFPLVLLALALAWSNAFAADPKDEWLSALPATPGQYLVDTTGAIDGASKTQLLGLLQELEQKTGVQFIVAVVPTLNGLSKEEAGLALAGRWKLGRKDKSDGLLLLLALGDHLYRFEVGYGLEGDLPDSYLGTLGREALVPLLKENRPGAAILKTAASIAAELAKAKNVTLSGMPDNVRTVPRHSGSPVPGWLVIALVIGGVLLSSFLRGGRSGFGGYRGGGYYGGFGGGFRSGGGGGGFGSFGGGGGGSFGGGGAGGSW